MGSAKKPCIESIQEQFLGSRLETAIINRGGPHGPPLAAWSGKKSRAGILPVVSGYCHPFVLNRSKSPHHVIDSAFGIERTPQMLLIIFVAVHVVPPAIHSRGWADSVLLGIRWGSRPDKRVRRIVGAIAGIIVIISVLGFTQRRGENDSQDQRWHKIFSHFVYLHHPSWRPDPLKTLVHEARPCQASRENLGPSELS